jgi:GNAT superfamily N-acetyltransferase
MKKPELAVIPIYINETESFQRYLERSGNRLEGINNLWKTAYAKDRENESLYNSLKRISEHLIETTLTLGTEFKLGGPIPPVENGFGFTVDNCAYVFLLCLYEKTEGSGTSSSSPDMISLLSTGTVSVYGNKENQTFLNLWNFSTNPFFQGKGYGTYLLNHIKDLAIVSKMPLLLHVSKVSYPSMSYQERTLFYAKNGFTIINKKPTSQYGIEDDAAAFAKFFFHDGSDIDPSLNPYIIGITYDSAKKEYLFTTKGIGDKKKLPINKKSVQNELKIIPSPHTETIGCFGCFGDLPSVRISPIIPEMPSARPILGGIPDDTAFILLHGELNLQDRTLTESRDFLNLKSFKVPENLEVIVHNDTGSLFYDYQWYAFISAYIDNKFNDIPIDILQLMFPPIRPIEESLKIPTKRSTKEQKIKFSKSYEKNVIFQNYLEGEGINYTSVRSYKGGDIIPDFCLSFQTQPEKPVAEQDIALKMGGIYQPISNTEFTYATTTLEMLLASSTTKSPTLVTVLKEMGDHTRIYKKTRCYPSHDNLPRLMMTNQFHKQQLSVLLATLSKYAPEGKKRRILLSCCSSFTTGDVTPEEITDFRKWRYHYYVGEQIPTYNKNDYKQKLNRVFSNAYKLSEIMKYGLNFGRRILR